MLEDRIGCWLASIGLNPYVFFIIILVVCFFILAWLIYSELKKMREHKTVRDVWNSMNKEQKLVVCYLIEQAKESMDYKVSKPKPVVYPPDCFYDQEKDK